MTNAWEVAACLPKTPSATRLPLDVFNPRELSGKHMYHETYPDTWAPRVAVGSVQTPHKVPLSSNTHCQTRCHLRHHAVRQVPTAPFADEGTKSGRRRRASLNTSTSTPSPASSKPQLPPEGRCHLHPEVLTAEPDNHLPQPHGACGSLGSLIRMSQGFQFCGVWDGRHSTTLKVVVIRTASGPRGEHHCPTRSGNEDRGSPGRRGTRSAAVLPASSSAGEPTLPGPGRLPALAPRALRSGLRLDCPPHYANGHRANAPSLLTSQANRVCV